ncbi:hypothetical protein D3C79_814480 [compost metagenome]
MTGGFFAIRGDVAAYGCQQVAIEFGGPAKPAIVAILVTQADIDLLERLVLHEAGYRHLHFCAIRRVDQLQYRHALRRVLTPTQDTVPGWVGSV